MKILPGGASVRLSIPEAGLLSWAAVLGYPGEDFFFFKKTNLLICVWNKKGHFLDSCCCFVIPGAELLSGNALWWAPSPASWSTFQSWLGAGG